jgi:hypothetical protein
VHRLARCLMIGPGQYCRLMDPVALLTKYPFAGLHPDPGEPCCSRHTGQREYQRAPRRTSVSHCIPSRLI